MTGPIQVVPEPTDADWALIVSKIKLHRCVPFLGAGASLGNDDEVGLPTASQLAKILAAQCGFPGKDVTDFFRVTQYYRMVFDEDLLREAVTAAAKVIANRIMAPISKLPCSKAAKTMPTNTI